MTAREVGSVITVSMIPFESLGDGLGKLLDDIPHHPACGRRHHRYLCFRCQQFRPYRRRELYSGLEAIAELAVGPSRHRASKNRIHSTFESASLWLAHRDLPLGRRRNSCASHICRGGGLGTAHWRRSIAHGFRDRSPREKAGRLRCNAGLARRLANQSIGGKGEYYG